LSDLPLINSLRSLTPSQRQALRQATLNLTTRQAGWMPDPANKPQQEAYTSPADILGYGGAVGGGKSDLLLGVSHQQHQRSVIYRRAGNEFSALIDRSREIFQPLGAGWRADSTGGRWRFPDSRMLEFISVHHDAEVTKLAGRPHDFIGFDQAEFFPRAVVVFITAWLRTTIRGQRTRVIMAFNAPTTAIGMWLIDYFGPWLDKKHPYPAEPGELRYFVADANGRDMAVDGPEPVRIGDRLVTPLSRTFIPSRTADNSYLRGTRYAATLDALEEPLRSQMRDGDFMASMEDDARQVIPTAWVEAAMERWTEEPPSPVLSALGVDVARGGRDRTVLTRRHDYWFGRQRVIPGFKTPNGQSVVAAIVEEDPGKHTPINIDVIGVGSSPVDIGEMQGLNMQAMIGGGASSARDRSGLLGFYNKRSEWYCRLREMLDPEYGDDLALPPDRELLADLTAPRRELTVRGWQVESKDDIIDRLKRSPDKGDSLVYAAAIDGFSGEAMMKFYEEQVRRTERDLNAPERLAPEVRKLPWHRDADAPDPAEADGAELYEQALRDLQPGPQLCRKCGEPLGQERVSDGVDGWHVACYR
jgi:hypothetical protein